MKKSVKPTKCEPTKIWVEAQRDHAQKKFEQASEELVWQLTSGGGIRNIHVLDTIRRLEFAYLQCAAYTGAANDLASD